MARLGDICRVVIDGDWIESKDQSETGLRLIQTGNIGIGEYLDKSSRAKFISEETFERLNCTEVFPGDILISRLPDPIGRACIIPQCIGKAITAVDCTIVRLDDSLCDDNYFINYTQSVKYTNELSKFLAGTTRTRISRKNLEKIEIPLPSLEEQKKIAAVLDKVSDLIAKRRQQLDKLDLLVKARFVEMFGDPIENNYGWSTHMLDSVCKTIVDCPHSTPRYTNVNTGYMCIRSSIVKKNRILWDEIEYISEQEYYQRIQRKQPKMGDVVYTREGAILGIAAMINCDCNVALGQRMMLLSPDTNICLPQFLSSVMNFESFLRKALKGLSGSASPHINVGDIKSFVIIIPPLALQQQYVSFFERTEETKRTISESLIKLETLKKALMQEYFG